MKFILILSEKDLKFLRYALKALHGDLTFGDVNYKQREVDLKYTKEICKKIDLLLGKARR